MKKIFKTTMAFVAAVSLLSLAGCAKVQKEDINPTYDGEAVKTQFSISMPSQLKSKMAQATVQGQATPVFRGMDQMVLIPFLTTKTSGNYAAVASTDSRLGTNIVLPVTGGTANSLAAGDLTTTGNAKVYTDVKIPVGTSAFLFYGKAIDASAGDPITAAADKFTYGYLNPDGLTGDDVADISFTPEKICTSFSSTKATGLVTYLNSIADADDEAATPVAWNDCAAVNASLAELYTRFCSLQAGSSLDIQAAVEDLYLSLCDNTDDLSKGIVNKIKNDTYVTVTEGTSVVLKGDYLGFPADLNLPDGAAILTNSAGDFSYVWTGASTTNTGIQVAEAQNYVFPSSLYYRANSTLGVSNYSEAEHYVDGATWATIYGNYTDQGSVLSTTRSVAIKNPIQYAVARFDMSIKASATALYDKVGDEITVGSNTFPVTGVLIGGQNSVDFEFAPSAAGSYTIYDKAVPASTYCVYNASTPAAMNWTLALQSVPNTAVNVAVELQNNSGKDFMGATGVVPAGCKFYLLATLDPAHANVTGYTVTNASAVGNRVFFQDYTTLANFTIAQGLSKTNPSWVEGTSFNATGLGAAYNVIPDLRTPQLELGLSVDLSWQTGIQFDVTF